MARWYFTAPLVYFPIFPLQVTEYPQTERNVTTGHNTTEQSPPIYNVQEAADFGFTDPEEVPHMDDTQTVAPMTLEEA